MDTIPDIEVQKIPEGFSCSDCIWITGCIKMDKINGTNMCENSSQTECPKRNFILSPHWEADRTEREIRNKKHQVLMKRQKKNKKKR